MNMSYFAILKPAGYNRTENQLRNTINLLDLLNYMGHCEGLKCYIYTYH